MKKVILLVLVTAMFSSCATTMYSAGPDRNGRCNIYGHKPISKSKGFVFRF